MLLLDWRGKPVRKADLPAPLSERLDAAGRKRDEARFQAEYGFAREADNLLRNYAVSRLAQEEAARKGVDLEQAARELATPEKVGLEDARALFVASDPSAPARDFEKVKAQLLAYIEEVARREATDKLLSEMEASNALRIHLQRPRRVGHRFALEGFPAVGRKEAPLTLVNFTDFLCDSCPAYNLKVSELVVKHGVDARFVFIPFPYTRPDRSMGLARGAMCAEEQGRYLDYHMKIVSLGGEARRADALAVAAEAGLDARAFGECFRKGTGVAPLLAAAQEEARRAGIMSVPVTFLQGEAFEGADAFLSLSERLAKKAR
jgi:protein-disulfide isomerase